MKQKTMIVEWLGRGRISIDYNGQRYAFNERPEKREIPIGAFITAMRSGNVHACNLIPYTGTEGTEELKQQINDLQEEKVELLSQIETLTLALENAMSEPAVEEKPDPVKDNKKSSVKKQGKKKDGPSK